MSKPWYMKGKQKVKRDWSQIFCIACDKIVTARETDGTEIYPHRPDLATTPFWKCDVCGNYVGMHHKNKGSRQPLGIIATPEIYKLRWDIHAEMDPLWQKGLVPRAVLYDRLRDVNGRDYHTGELRSIEECEKVLAEVKKIKEEYTCAN